MSARDVAFTLMALGHVAGCSGKSDAEILAEAVGEIVRLEAERDRYKAALEWVRENVMIATCYEFTVAVDEALEPTVVCDSCHRPLGDDAPLYEDADICRNCHDQIQEAEMAELASMLQHKETK